MAVSNGCLNADRNINHLVFFFFFKGWINWTFETNWMYPENVKSLSRLPGQTISLNCVNELYSSFWFELVSVTTVYYLFFCHYVVITIYNLYALNNMQYTYSDSPGCIDIKLDYYTINTQVRQLANWIGFLQ